MREKDPQYLKWIHQQPEFRCLITGSATADACHLRSKGAGGSDYWVYPLLHEIHMKQDHAPRGRSYNENRLKQELAEWYYHLRDLHLRYYLEQTTKRREALLEFPTIQALTHGK